ncbi:Protein FYV4, mitochondrial [Lachnellula willkommii]|uniref:Small ribosomal subunit protein mS41 n=1 Tax=Lachnellula willkommii TaxID=215461 RepID=A0A559MMA6_9HELO|nr:Protein FYV4, mitochondrial [Lachnellula willkommii]
MQVEAAAPALGCNGIDAPLDWTAALTNFDDKQATLLNITSTCIADAPSIMIVKPPHLRPIPSFLLPFAQPLPHARRLHQRVKAAPIPRPTPFVPDAQTFLTLIGRKLSQHASKIPSWDALFSLTSAQLRELGVEPPRTRRYLLRWREKFRNGQFGIGGDIQHVENGTAELRVVEVAGQHAGNHKIVINVPAGGSATLETLTEKPVPVSGVHIKRAHTIVGPHVQPLKGGKAAKIEVKEGLWEDKRGHKIDGGERRQAEIRAKRRGEERRATR